MLALFDVPSLDRALALSLDPKLRRLLRERVDHLRDGPVAEITYYLCVGPGISEDDILDEIGMVPTRSLDGAQFGSDSFHPWHQYVADLGGWFEVILGAGNDAAFVLMIQDSDGVEPTLIDYCRTYAGDSVCG
ncbi:hypothetical protein [Sphingomonas sp.]|uniref:hypothetical protein n=1 Tax=Sphingomonas sp. TaxID=28214 RepID=UPI003F6FEFDD